jgi:hypothetical protein
MTFAVRTTTGRAGGSKPDIQAERRAETGEKVPFQAAESKGQRA